MGPQITERSLIATLLDQVREINTRLGKLDVRVGRLEKRERTQASAKAEADADVRLTQLRRQLVSMADSLIKKS